MQQSVRVYEDRKSGRHLDELKKRRRLLMTPHVLAEAINVIVQVAEQQLDAPVVAGPSSLSLTLSTLRALRRLVWCEDLGAELIAQVEEAT
eukprot:362597-Prymnesium_polylepis.1